MALAVEEFKKFQKLVKKKKLIEKHLKRTNERVEKLQEVLIKNMNTEEIANLAIKVNGEKFLIHQRKQIWSAYIDPDDPDKRTKLIMALKQAGLGWMVSEGFNSNTLAAYLRELDEKEMEMGGKGEEVKSLLPEALAKVIKPKPKITLVVRKQRT